MMIEHIKISSLRNNELLQFLNDISDRCIHYDLEELKLDKIHEVLKGEVLLLNNTYNKETGSDVTDLLIETDANRDSDFMGIKTLCEGYAYLRNEKISNAAKLILKSINKHGKNITRQNYQAETLILDAILKDWREDKKLKKALEILNLTEWVKMLDSENEKFSTTYQERIDDKLKNQGLSFTELRAKAINAYKALCSNIFAFSIISENKNYQELINAINLIIADYELILQKRETKQEEV